MIALALKYWKIAGVVVLCTTLALTWHARDLALIEKGRIEEQLRELRTKTRIDSIAEREAATTVVHDTIRLTKWLTQYDTSHRTLRITDTVEVRRFIQVADSTVRICKQTVADLGLSCARKDTLITDLRKQLALPQPRRVASFRERLVWGAGGFVIGALVRR